MRSQFTLSCAFKHLQNVVRKIRRKALVNQYSKPYKYPARTSINLTQIVRNQCFLFFFFFFAVLYCSLYLNAFRSVILQRSYWSGMNKMPKATIKLYMQQKDARLVSFKQSVTSNWAIVPHRETLNLRFQMKIIENQLLWSTFTCYTSAGAELKLRSLKLLSSI